MGLETGFVDITQLVLLVVIYFVRRDLAFSSFNSLPPPPCPPTTPSGGPEKAHFQNGPRIHGRGVSRTRVASPWRSRFRSALLPGLSVCQTIVELLDVLMNTCAL